eukprot:CAMPEP_0174235936 /NCGR_PEP_ID=MMETSP0417-20130205/5225_1 /TAXON_ID=242541 /ORGANISM="Mayorella sp, Strain BSH-02190019" /LENGTH=149 /DNA_ID=CAMNT_0015314515 /DNA_START=52 /DNA_END=498 /DNA_ORIENTATION=+
MTSSADTKASKPSLFESTDAYNLIVYSLPEHPQDGDIYKYLETLKPVGPPLSFPVGALNNFFTCIFSLTNLDLLPLIGSTLDRYEDEDDYVCGSLDTDLMKKACHEIQGMGGTKEVVSETAEKFQLDPEDFRRDVQHLCALFTTVLKEG